MNKPRNTTAIFRESVAREIENMTQQERLELRQQNCGSFEYRLIDTWYVADNGNKARLEEAFKNTQFDLT